MRGVTAYFLSFVLARGGLFVAPIILANILPVQDYGRLEFAYALAALLAIAVGLGAASALPNILIRKSGGGTWQGVLYHQILVVTTLCLGAIVCWANDFSDLIWIIAVFAGILVLQTFWSITLKSHGRINSALMVDAGFWVVLAGAALFSSAINERQPHLVFAVLFAALMYLAVLFFYAMRQIDWALIRNGRAVAEYSESVRAGIPLLCMALLAVTSASLGRLGAGGLGDEELAGNYAVLYRATILPIVAHQILLGAWFRELFQLTENEVRNRLSFVVASVALGVLGFWMLADLIGILLGNAFIQTLATYRKEGFLILSQCILWSAISLNDLIGTRHLAAQKMARWGIGYFLVVLPLALLFLDGKPLTMLSLVIAHSGVMLGYFLTQVIVLCGLKVKMLGHSIFVIFAFLGISLFIN